MITEIEVKNEQEFSEDTPKCLLYSPSMNGWMISSKMDKIGYKVIQKEDWFKYRAGSVKHIFPEYNPKIHHISQDSNRTEHLGFNDIGINLYKYSALDEPVDLPYGCFSFIDTTEGTVLKKMQINTDTYVDIGRTEGKDLYKEYQNFRKLKPQFIKHGRRVKRAFLFYGPPGNSKTTEICRLASHAEEDKFRVFFLGSKEVSLHSLSDFKSILEKEDNVFVLEELTERIEYPEELLSFLDGESSWNNCFLVGTTNYPEDLPWNIIDRPTRFRSLIEFGPPTLEQRAKYLKHIGLSDEEVKIAAKATEGLSMDYLINIAFDSLTGEESIIKVIDRYKTERKKMSGSFKGGIGIK